MGSQAKVAAILDGRKSEVRAHLDSESLQFSGTPRMILPLAGIHATTQGEWLVIHADRKVIKLLLGATKAALWAKKVSNPPSLATKLGLKPTSTVWLSGDATSEIVAAIREVGGETFSRRKPSSARPVDLIFVDYASAKDERRLRSVIPFLNEANGSLGDLSKGPHRPGRSKHYDCGSPERAS